MELQQVKTEYIPEKTEKLKQKDLESITDDENKIRQKF